LFDALRSQPQSPAQVDRVVDMLESCGAIEACRKEARELGEASWAKLSAQLLDSLAKLKLRAFTLYACDRAA
jgi:geranylgeranyl pyrophosphate synthase